ncbi:MAG: nitric oxide synthase oxygenase [Sporichthyaceae bacterium]
MEGSVTMAPARAHRRDAVDPAQAEDFLREAYAENPNWGEVESRVQSVRIEIAGTGTYRHTAEELEYGARVAWRNAARCIGRLYWRSLVVRDRRHVLDPAGIAAECVEHLRLATNGGRVRPVITIFAPDAPNHRAARIRNDQLVRYAGYRAPDGRVVGDPALVETTDLARKLEWRGTGGRFDVLPLIVEAPDHALSVHEVPADAVMHVPITHPSTQFYWFSSLRLQWYAVPAIANMDMHIGGVVYGCAPFNGWYMGTEIGARNFADADRYDLLPTIAQKMRLDTSSERTLWRDRALIELNVAVLHSYAQAGVTMTDHHTESARFLTHLEKEERAGRDVPGDWSWLVPPISGAATGVFHRYYDTTERCPAYVPRDAGCPAHRAE